MNRLEITLLLIAVLAAVYQHVTRKRLRMVPNWELLTANRKKLLGRSLVHNLPNNLISMQARNIRYSLEKTNSLSRIYFRDLAWYWRVRFMCWWLNIRTVPYRIAGKTYEEAGEIVMKRWSEAAQRKERKSRWKTITRR